MLCLWSGHVSSSCVFLFPASGFSRQMVAILKECNCAFSTFNILVDEEVRKAVGGEERKHEGGGQRGDMEG